MDVDNITLPTTVDSLIQILDPHVPITLTDTAKDNKNLPGYILIGRGSFEVYAKVSMEDKIAMCDYITDHGGAYIIPSEYDAIFSRTTLPVTTGLLAESLRHCNIDHVAVSVYGMKERHQMDNVGNVPVSTDTEVTRRFDIGYNHHVDQIPFFALDEDLIDNCSGKVRPTYVRDAWERRGISQVQLHQPAPSDL